MKHILLIFLSDIKTGVKDGKVSINESFYETAEGAKIHVTNESAVRYIRDKGITLDKIFIFASEKVRGDIIDRSGKKYLVEDGKPRTHLEYFKERLSNEFQLNVDKCIDVYPYEEKKAAAPTTLKASPKWLGVFNVSRRVAARKLPCTSTLQAACAIST
ncbi:MAG: hypothetical protein J5809_05355 [Selenomonadaceae bacterium]|nr:hypothetical protein [Selenomonadaceae bacterium]